MADHLAAVAATGSVEELFGLLGRLRRDGIGGLFGLEIDTDADDPDAYVPYLFQSGLGLPDESYYHVEQFAEVRAAYAQHVPGMLALAEIPDSDSVAAAAIELETDIAKAHWDRVRSRDRSQTHNPTDQQGLFELLPEAWWRAWLQGSGADERTLRRTEIMQPSFFSGVRELLTAERLPSWRAWLTWKIVRSSAPYLTDALVEKNFDFYGRTLSGTPELRDRWKRGVGLVEGVVGDALGKLYVERHFRPEAKERMDHLVANLLAAYRSNIQQLSWMTETTKKFALEKLSAFNPKIGYPEKFKDYAGLVITATDLIGNIRRGAAAEFDRELAKLGAPVDRTEWFMTPQTVNAYYNPGMNEIVFPAAILQRPFFDMAAGDATNYGGIGAVIGHEIGHGFDDQGSKYDGRGALRDWWTDDDRAAFDALTKKLVDQYAELSPEGADGQKINGELTLGENIGDLGGLGIAYQAWLIARAAAADNSDEKAGAQELFSNWARAWETKVRPAEAIRRLAIDPHSPPEFRCNQVVKNLNEFVAAFDVAPADGMWLPEEDRVRIW